MFPFEKAKLKVLVDYTNELIAFDDSDLSCFDIIHKEIERWLKVIVDSKFTDIYNDEYVIANRILLKCYEKLNERYQVNRVLEKVIIPEELRLVD